MSACAFSVTGDDSSAARSLATIYEFSSGPTAACMPPWGFTCVDMSERDRPGQRGFLPCYESDSSDSIRNTCRWNGAARFDDVGAVVRADCRTVGVARVQVYCRLRPSTAVYGRLGSQATGASRVCTGETATLAGQPASLANEQRTAVVAREGSGRPPARCWVPPGPALRATGNASDTTSLGFLPPRSGRGRGVEIELVPAPFLSAVGHARRTQKSNFRNAASR